MKNIFLSVLFLFNFSNGFAQHCPFDGTSIIMVNIYSNGVLQKGNDYNLVLREIDNPNPDTCKYAKGILLKNFKSVTELHKQNERILAREKTSKVDLSAKGNFYVLLNMAETQCMQPSATDFTYYDRKFLIGVTNKKTGKKISLGIPKNKIYSLCTNGDWSRINALEIKL